MIHSAKFGSIERFFGVLVEHYAGAFPAWLAPVQVVGIPIRSENVPYLELVAERLRAEGLRAEVDTSDDRMQKKILHAQQQKVPFMFVAGPRDVEAEAVSVRYRNGVERRGVPLDDAIIEVARNVASRQVEPDALNPDAIVDPESATS
jgi:threonyl-tRNA synthetase